MKNTPFHQKTQTKNNGSDLFKDEFKDIAPIEQDKIPPQRFSSKQNSGLTQKNKADLAEIKQAAAAFVQSIGVQPPRLLALYAVFILGSGDSARIL